ncbi:hypothetical protein KUA24_47 [Vibrio phage HNL01]|nr:hypothetical protein KUA24_47 [Vibrio phage HNL01]
MKKLPKGEDNANHKLSNQCVIEIYQNLLLGQTIKSLADAYNVSTTTIGRIKKKEAWVHITSDFENLVTRKRATPLRDSQVTEITSCIQSGNDFKTTKKLLNFSFTQDQFYRVKSLL